MADNTPTWGDHSFLPSLETDPEEDDALKFINLDGADLLSPLRESSPFEALQEHELISSAFDEEECALFLKHSNALAQDDGFARLQGNGSGQVKDSAACSAGLDSRGGESCDSKTYAMAYDGEHESSYNNQYPNHKPAPALTLGQVNMLHAEGDLADVFLQGKQRVMNHLSPTSPSKMSLPSPGSSTAEKLKGLSLGTHPYRFDDKVGVTVPYSGSGLVAGVAAAGTPLPSSAGNKYPPAPLTLPAAGTCHPPYGGQKLSPTGMLGSSPNSAHIPTSMPCSTYDRKDNVYLGVENLRQAQQANAMYMPPPGGLQPRTTDGGGPPGYVQEVDANGDGLRPLHSMAHRSSNIMQRSLSSHSLGQFWGLPPGPQGNGHMAAVELSRLRDLPGPGSLPQQRQGADMQVLNMRPITSPMRRVHSTGDIQTLQGASGHDEGSSKIGTLTVEERKLRINRYKQKRSERNFNKKIKYACRKTLADSRPRVRGRFAKNDDIELPVKQTDGKHEEDEEDADMVEDEDLFGDEDSPS